MQLGAIIKIGLDNFIIAPTKQQSLVAICYTIAMEQDENHLIEQMEKINYNLSQISRSLAFFKWLAVIFIAILILLGITTLAIAAKNTSI